jgi:teichuronic acid biosynthesis glycosyltransferase TuaG
MLVSIITPCYNLKNYIADAYKALLGQTHTEWEWIIADDASTDNTLAIIASFNDPRIRILPAERNCGNLSILRNKAARVAAGEFFAFVDGDDFCELRKLERQVSLFTEYPAMAWNHTGFLVLQEETGELSKPKPPPVQRKFIAAEEAFGHLALRNFVCISSVMIRKEVFFAAGAFNEKFHRCEDIEFWLRLTAQGYAMGYCPEPLLKYRVRNTGLFISKTLEYLQMNFEVYNDIRLAFPDICRRHENTIRQYLSTMHLKIAIRLLYENDRKSAKHFNAAFRLSPSLKKLLWLGLSACAPGLLRSYLKGRLT